MQIRLDETFNAEQTKQNTQLPVSSANTAGLKEGDVIMASVERIEGDALLLRVSGGALLRAALQSESLFGLGDAIEANVSRSGDSFMLTVINVTHPIAPTGPEIAARTVQPQTLPEMLAVMSRNPGMDSMMARFLANRGIPDTTENLAALTQLSRGGSVGSLLGRILDVISQPESSLLPKGDTTEETLSQQYRTPQQFTGDAETQQGAAQTPEGAQPQGEAAAAQTSGMAPRMAQTAQPQSGAPANAAENTQPAGTPAQPEAAQGTPVTTAQPEATQSAPGTTVQQEAAQRTTGAPAQQEAAASPVTAQPQVYKAEGQPQAAAPPTAQTAEQTSAQTAQPEAAALPDSPEALAQLEQAAKRPAPETETKHAAQRDIEHAEIPANGKETAQKAEIKARIGDTIRELLIRPEEQSGEHIKKTVDELPMALKTLKSMLIQSDINNKEIYLKGADETLRQMDLADKAMKFEHMQLPVVLRNGDYRTAELFVFRQPAKRKAEGEAGTTILVALDTQHIGRVEALIKESGGGISLEFRLEQPEITEKLKQRAGAIAQVAEAGGYRLTGIRFAGLEKRTTVLNAGEAIPEAGRATYGIDVTI